MRDRVVRESGDVHAVQSGGNDGYTTSAARGPDRQTGHAACSFLAMDDHVGIEQRHLERANDLIAHIDARVGEQRQRIEYLKEDGCDSRTAEEILTGMLASLDTLRHTRRAIEVGLRAARSGSRR